MVASDRYQLSPETGCSDCGTFCKWRIMVSVLSVMFVAAGLSGLLSVGGAGSVSRADERVDAGKIQSPVTEVAVEIPADQPTATTTTTETEKETGTETETEASAAVDSTETSIVTGATPDEAGFPVNEFDTLESPEDRRKRLAELASHIGPLLRSILERDQSSPADRSGSSVVPDISTPVVPNLSTDPEAARAAESEDRQIVVFQMSGPKRRTYALIPLTPAMEAAVSPMKPFLGTASLEAIANSLAALLNNEDRSDTAVATSAGTDNPESADGRVPDSESMADAASDADRRAVAVSVGAAQSMKSAAEELRMQSELASRSNSIPDWVRKPDGGRVVVRTETLLPGDDPQPALRNAVNQALEEHLRTLAESLSPEMRHQALRANMVLRGDAFERCVVTTFERVETIETETEGPKSVSFWYALVEFPEDVDRVVLEHLRKSVQFERVVRLGIIVGLLWLSLFSTAFVTRLWTKGSAVRKLIAVPVVVLLTLPLFAVSVGLAIQQSRGAPPTPEWLPLPKVQVILSDVRH